MAGRPPRMPFNTNRIFYGISAEQTKEISRKRAFFAVRPEREEYVICPQQLRPGSANRVGRRGASC